MPLSSTGGTLWATSGYPCLSPWLQVHQYQVVHQKLLEYRYPSWDKSRFFKIKNREWTQAVSIHRKTSTCKEMKSLCNHTNQQNKGIRSRARDTHQCPEFYANCVKYIWWVVAKNWMSLEDSLLRIILLIT